MSTTDPQRRLHRRSWFLPALRAVLWTLSGLGAFATAFAIAAASSGTPGWAASLAAIPLLLAIAVGISDANSDAPDRRAAYPVPYLLWKLGLWAACVGAGLVLGRIRRNAGTAAQGAARRSTSNGHRCPERFSAPAQRIAWSRTAPDRRRPMTSPGTTPQTLSLQAVLAQLGAHGAVTLPGRACDPTLRWMRSVAGVRNVAIGVLALGMALMILGGVLRDVGSWALALALGGFLAFAGVVALGTALLLRALYGPRLAAEAHPVTIDRSGTVVRGIGPIPWSDVAPPERTRVRVRNDIGGDCTVMPLTALGHERVNAQPGWFRVLVGPKPYLRFSIPYLLLPGVDGLTEDETLELFRAAHWQFAR